MHPIGDEPGVYPDGPWEKTMEIFSRLSPDFVKFKLSKALLV